MALEGTLKDFSLADIFQLIGLQRKTGILTLQSDEDTVTITFNQGMVVGAESVEKRLEDRLGRVLVKRGTISEEMLEQALEIQKETLQRLGYVLVKSNFISTEDLRNALIQQIQQIIYRLFRWQEGYYHFRQEKSVHFDRENVTPLSAENILMEGVRMLDEWPHIERLIGSFHTIHVPVEDAEGVKVLDIDEELQISSEDEPGKDLSVTRHQAMTLELLDGTRDVQAVIEASRLLEFEVCKALAGLIQKGIVAPLHQKEGDLEDAPVTPRMDFKKLGSNLAAVFFIGVTLFYALPKMIDQVTAIRSHSTPTWDLYEDEVRLHRVRYALVVYQLLNRRYPDDLAILVDEGYLPNSVIQDSSNKPIRYTRDRQGFNLTHPGPDGLFRTEDDMSLRVLAKGLNTEPRFFKPVFSQNPVADDESENLLESESLSPGSILEMETRPLEQEEETSP